MSTKATSSSRAAARALVGSNRAAEEARHASSASRLAKDAIRAAVAAACAAERARIADGAGRAQGSTGMRKLEQNVRAAAEDAVEYARDAMRAEGEQDVVGAVHAADLSLAAARKASSLAAEASVMSGKSKEMASGNEAKEPTLSEDKRRSKSSHASKEDTFVALIARSAHYLVTYDGAIVATFAREEDAFLFESELADLDHSHGTTSGKCEVIERKTGHRLGGYLITGGQMLLFLHDEEAEKRFRKGVRRF